MSSRRISRGYEFHSVLETEEFGRSLSSRLTPGMAVCLHGDLGTGKSVLSRAIAGALGVTERMPSPTYTLVEAYNGRVPVLHVDLYRLSDEEEFEMLGIAEDMERSVTLIEWPDRAPILVARAEINIWLSIETRNTDHRTCIVESSLS